MLKFIFRSYIIKNWLPFLLIILLFAAYKDIAFNQSEKYPREVNSIVQKTEGMTYEEAKTFIASEISQMMSEAAETKNEELHKLQTSKIADIGLALESRLRVLNHAEENINNAKYDTGISYGMPSDYYINNTEAYTKLDPPNLVGQGWSTFFAVQGINPAAAVIFLMVGLIYIRRYERRVYLSDGITKYGKKYARGTFVYFAILSCAITLINFAVDVLSSGILTSANIFTAQIQGIDTLRDSFVPCTIFGFLLYSAVFQLLCAVNMFCIFSLFARITKDTYGFAVICLCLMLLLVIVNVTAPQIGCCISLGFPNVSVLFSKAAYLGGLYSPALVLIINAAASAAGFFFIGIQRS